MAISSLPAAAGGGFEGFEKRLELRFVDPAEESMGLRGLPFECLQQVLEEVQCSIVSAVGNRWLDSYVLSESSLFVYREKMIIKTCGTTRLLRCIPCLLQHTTGMLGLQLCMCRYTRGSFIFPEAQPFPHTSFREEVLYLDHALPTNLCYRKACVMPDYDVDPLITTGTSNSLQLHYSDSSTSCSWHVYSASSSSSTSNCSCRNSRGSSSSCPPLYFITMEVCMMELDRAVARRFFRHADHTDVEDGGDMAGKEMTVVSGINGINPNALICDYAFHPCGYSMNGVDAGCYSTIHVTPEEGYSYASFECCGSEMKAIQETLQRVAAVFRPGTISVSLCVEQLLRATCNDDDDDDDDDDGDEYDHYGGDIDSVATAAAALKAFGNEHGLKMMISTSSGRGDQKAEAVVEQFPGAGTIVYEHNKNGKISIGDALQYL